MDQGQTNEAEAKRGANPIRTRNAAKKPDKARKPLRLIDPERLIKALRYLPALWNDRCVLDKTRDFAGDSRDF
jgi:hypothetical protein